MYGQFTGNYGSVFYKPQESDVVRGPASSRLDSSQGHVLFGCRRDMGGGDIHISFFSLLPDFLRGYKVS